MASEGSGGSDRQGPPHADHLHVARGAAQCSCFHGFIWVYFSLILTEVSGLETTVSAHRLHLKRALGEARAPGLGHLRLPDLTFSHSRSDVNTFSETQDSAGKAFPSSWHVYSCASPSQAEATSKPGHQPGAVEGEGPACSGRPDPGGHPQQGGLSECPAEGWAAGELVAHFGAPAGL